MQLYKMAASKLDYRDTFVKKKGRIQSIELKFLYLFKKKIFTVPFFCSRVLSRPKLIENVNCGVRRQAI